MPSKPLSIFDLMREESESKVDQEAEKKKLRQELLAPTGVKDIFKEGKITINKFTCVGGQCKLCIKACPTNALYWGSGGVGITEDLCVYCGACVLNCMVNDCIKIERKRDNGKVERFSKPSDVIKIAESQNSQKRFERVKTNAATMRCYKEKDSVKEYQKLRQLYIEYQKKV